ncbi:Enhancer of polycomb homolog 2 [Linum grandiflorum]
MSRLSFRPRPLDIHKKLPIWKSKKDFEDDDSTPTATRNSQLLRIAAADFENEAHHPHVPAKRLASEIPTPQFDDVDTYERDYGRTFFQPNSYIRARGARAEIGEFVEYDLDNEDEDWLQEFNKDKDNLPPEKFEVLLFKFEALDHKARERAGVITPTLGSPIPVLLQFDAAIEALQAHAQTQSITYGLLRTVYNYWKEKRERWQKPVLRRLQPPPPVSDTNPYNVFRPREKAHRLHTRRMQRRENNVQSFEKLRQVRRNLEQAKTILEALIKREEKKREVTETEVSLQRIQIKYKHETELLEDSLAFPGFQPISSKFASSEDEIMDSDDFANSRPRTWPPLPIHNPTMTDTNILNFPAATIRRRHGPDGWLNKMDPNEPVLLFTKPLVAEKLASAGIQPPVDPSPSTRDGSGSSVSYRFRGRMGRGGRIVFDRWNPLSQSPIDLGNTLYMAPRPRPSTFYN